MLNTLPFKKNHIIIASSLLGITLLGAISTHVFFQKKIPTSAVTYEFNGGRFGDNIITYCKAKWVANKYNIPLLFRNFESADQLMMSELEQRLTKEKKAKFAKIKMILDDEKNTIDPYSNTLYVVHYYYKDKDWPAFDGKTDWIQHDVMFKSFKKNSAFVTKLKQMLAPQKETVHIPSNKNNLSIALHVRKGSGPDTEEVIKDHPLKFPPDTFFIEQVKTIAQENPDKNIDLYLFTDDKNPQKLAQEYSALLNEKRIRIFHRSSSEQNSKALADDLQLMTECDILVRGSSSFSKIAQIIGNHTKIVFPTKYIRNQENKITDFIVKTSSSKATI